MENLIDEKKAMEIINLTFDRLRIPRDASKTKLDEALKALAIDRVLTCIDEIHSVLGYKESLEVVRATCDCLELIMKDGFNRDKP